MPASSFTTPDPLAQYRAWLASDALALLSIEHEIAAAQHRLENLRDSRTRINRSMQELRDIYGV